MTKSLKVVIILPLFLLTSLFSSLHSAETKEKSSTKKVNNKDSSNKTSGGSSEAKKRSLAEILKNHSFGLGLGETFLLGDFEEHGENNITLDFFYAYKASYSFDFLANMHYSNHSFRDEEVTLAGVSLGMKAKLYHIDSLVPYALGGLGFYLPSTKTRFQNTLNESEEKLTFGVHFGLGSDLHLNKNMSVGVLAHYHNPFDVKQENAKQVEGSYVKLMMTTMYSF